MMEMPIKQTREDSANNENDDVSRLLEQIKTPTTLIARLYIWNNFE